MMGELSSSLIFLGIIEDISGAIGGAFMTLFGSELFLGIFIFIILMIFTFILGLGMIVGSVVIIPASFLVFEYIPSGRIFLAIILGFVVGIGLNHLVKR